MYRGRRWRGHVSAPDDRCHGNGKKSEILRFSNRNRQSQKLFIYRMHDIIKKFYIPGRNVKTCSV